MKKNKVRNKSLKKNFLYNFAYQLLAIIVPLVTSPYIARVLGVKNIGIYSWTQSIATYFSLFVALGVDNYGSREIAYVRDDKEVLSKKFWSIYFCQLINFTIVLIVYLIFTFYITPRYKIVFIILIFSIISKGIDVAWFYSGLEEFKITVIRNSLVKIITLVCVFAFVKNKTDLNLYIAINSVGTLIGQLTLWMNMNKYVSFSMPTWKEIVHNFKPLIILFIPVLAIAVFTYMDKLMIGIFSTVSQNGYYENADKIISVPKALITTIGTVMLPRTAYLIASNKKEESYHYIELSMVYTVILASAISFGMAGVSEMFSVIYWGANFKESGRLIMWLSPCIVISVVGSVIRSQFLIPLAKDREYTISLLAGAVVNFIVNMLLIPRYGAFGAVIGTIFAEVVLFVLQLYFVKNDLPLKKYFKESFIFVCIGLLMFFVLIKVENYLEPNFFSLLILVFLGAIIYGIPTFGAIKVLKFKIFKEIENNLTRRFGRWKRN